MPNQPIEYEESEFDPIQAFTKIKKFLTKYSTDDWENPHKYIIEEHFPDGQVYYMPNTYKLLNIKLNIEDDGMAYFNDAEGILLEQMYNDTPLPLQVIQMNSVIGACISTYYKFISITLENGYINIRY